VPRSYSATARSFVVCQLCSKALAKRRGVGRTVRGVCRGLDLQLMECFVILFGCTLNSELIYCFLFLPRNWFKGGRRNWKERHLRLTSRWLQYGTHSLIFIPFSCFVSHTAPLRHPPFPSVYTTVFLCSSNAINMYLDGPGPGGVVKGSLEISPEWTVSFNPKQPNGITIESCGVDVLNCRFATLEVRPHPAPFLTRRVLHVMLTFSCSPCSHLAAVVSKVEGGY
jgi:hypothetical protein